MEFQREQNMENVLEIGAIFWLILRSLQLDCSVTASHLKGTAIISISRASQWRPKLLQQSIHSDKVSWVSYDDST